jgi:acetyl-CoA carboxylase biotin carboxyl carrier protein
MADEILSPLPGTFYHRPAPDQPPYKKVGDSVAKGDVVGLVEVMKSFHEVKAQVDGVVAEVLVENEGAVQAGQPVMKLA